MVLQSSISHNIVNIAHDIENNIAIMQAAV